MTSALFWEYFWAIYAKFYAKRIGLVFVNRETIEEAVKTVESALLFPTHETISEKGDQKGKHGNKEM